MQNTVGLHFLWLLAFNYFHLFNCKSGVSDVVLGPYVWIVQACLIFIGGLFVCGLLVYKLKLYSVVMWL